VEAHPVNSALLVEIEAHPLITATVVEEEAHRLEAARSAPPPGTQRHRVEAERQNEAQSRVWTTLGVLLAVLVGLVASTIGEGAEVPEGGAPSDAHTTTSQESLPSALEAQARATNHTAIGCAYHAGSMYMAAMLQSEEHVEFASKVEAGMKRLPSEDFEEELDDRGNKEQRRHCIQQLCPYYNVGILGTIGAGEHNRPLDQHVRGRVVALPEADVGGSKGRENAHPCADKIPIRGQPHRTTLGHQGHPSRMAERERDGRCDSVCHAHGARVGSRRLRAARRSQLRLGKQHPSR
jgi:hypothetical protein